MKKMFVKTKMLYKFLQTLVFLVISFFTFFILKTKFSSESSDQILKDILKSDKFTFNKNIFFLDTSSFAINNSQNTATLSHRQACSVESAAISNSKLLVFVIFSDRSILENSDAIKALQQYPNIIFLKIDLKEFVKNTPVEKWIASGKIYETEFLANNISNILRALLLWK